jgi:hypothetical protein
VEKKMMATEGYAVVTNPGGKSVAVPIQPIGADGFSERVRRYLNVPKKEIVRHDWGTMAVFSCRSGPPNCAARLTVRPGHVPLGMLYGRTLIASTLPEAIAAPHARLLRDAIDNMQERMDAGLIYGRPV